MRAYVLSDQPLDLSAPAPITVEPGRPNLETFVDARARAAWHLEPATLERELPRHGVALTGEDPIALTLAIAKALPSHALVLFGDALHEASSFLDQAKDASKDDPPIFLWVAFELGGHEDGTTSLLTHGATAVGAPMEIEIDRSRRDPEALLERAADAVLVAITAGAEVADGDTIELSEDEVRVRFMPSLRGDGSRAWRLRVP